MTRLVGVANLCAGAAQRFVILAHWRDLLEALLDQLRMTTLIRRRYSQ